MQKAIFRYTEDTEDNFDIQGGEEDTSLVESESEMPKSKLVEISEAILNMKYLEMIYFVETIRQINSDIGDPFNIPTDSTTFADLITASAQVILERES